MAESLDIFRYISYLRSRWRWIAGSCAVAVALAIGVSMALPREYTAAARIVIEPPAGTDPRSVVAVSPIYLESLKTYEQFAASDTLFQKAIDRFHLRVSLGARSIESLKKHVLKVAIVRNTRILEIDATLPDPRLAQQVAQALAEGTVELSRSLATEGDRDLVSGIGQQESEIRRNLEEIETTWGRLLAEEPVADLQAAMSKSAELRATLEQQALSTEQELADAGERQKTGGEAERTEARKEAANASARLEEMRGHHKSRAAFHWVRSFHFERAAQAEAELLAPRLVAAVRAEIEQDVSQSSGDVGVFLTGKTARERAAVGAMADASQALSATAEAKAARHPASMTGLAMALVGSIVAAGKALGADFLGDMRAILPALAGQANRMIEATKPTPAENLQKKVPDWRIEGIAVADRRMRRAADCPAQMSARQTLVGYARAVADDGGLMAKVRGADPACAAWIEKVSGRAGQAGARTAGQPAARTAAAPAAAAHGFH